MKRFSLIFVTVITALMFSSAIAYDGVFLIKRTPLGGFYALGSAPPPDTNMFDIVLNSQPALVDNNFITGISTINLATTKYHNIGILVSSTRSVDSIFVCVNVGVSRNLANDPNLTIPDNWRAYWSNVNAVGTWQRIIIQSVSVTPFDPLNNIFRYEIHFVSPQNASFFKVINMETVDVPGITNVLVTEIEAYGVESLPLPPSSLTTKATSSSSIILGWKDNSNNEEGFKIYRKEGACDSSNSWSLIATKGANVKTHTNTGLTANTIYSYQVRAYNAAGNSSYSNCASSRTALSGTPKAPTNLNATSISGSQIKLLWTDNSTDEKSFKIYKKAGAGSWVPLATKGENIVSHTDNNAPGNTTTTTYSYYIQACNSSECSPKTNTAIVPYRPTNLSATPVSSSRINLKWADKSNNESGFQVYRKTGVCSSTNSWSRIKTTGPNITLYSNTGLTSGKTYSYKVSTYKKSSAMPYANGYSSYSGCKSATTP
jgi:hypothetical protein